MRRRQCSHSSLRVFAQEMQPGAVTTCLPRWKQNGAVQRCAQSCGCDTRTSVRLAGEAVPGIPFLGLPWRCSVPFAVRASKLSGRDERRCKVCRREQIHVHGRGSSSWTSSTTTRLRSSRVLTYPKYDIPQCGSTTTPALEPTCGAGRVH